jgi:RNA polymerase sigma-70 factor (ECF subfamily)
MMGHPGRIERAADRLDSATKRGCFSARAHIEDRDDLRRVTATAVRRAQEGDREAIRYLYVRYADNVFGYVRSILRDDHDAEDVTQQVFAKMMVVIGKYEQRSMPFSAWVLRVAHNAAIDHVRAWRAVPREEVCESTVPADERGTECRRNLCDALEELTEEQREVLVLRHVLGLAPAEIAQRLGKSEDSVHALHYRGRGTARRSLVAMHGAPMARSRAS